MTGMELQIGCETDAKQIITQGASSNTWGRSEKKNVGLMYNRPCVQELRKFPQAEAIKDDLELASEWVELKLFRQRKQNVQNF